MKKTAVIYARFSSDRQTEQSIEGQLRVCEEYARTHGILILDTYIDRAMSGTNDMRPDFQRMQRMAENGEIGTIIVKDLSRFGREQVEMGRLTQIVYPSLGVTFIAIQENVNTAEGTGLEMMPFYNIFNEWG